MPDMKNRAWTLPLLVAVFIGVVGWAAHRVLESTMKSQLRGQLQTVLNADITALRMWIRIQKSVAEGYANQPQIRTLIHDLVQAAAHSVDSRDLLLQAPALAELRRVFRPTVSYQSNAVDPVAARMILQQHGYTTFAVVDQQGRTLAAFLDELIGHRALADLPFVKRALRGETTVSRPFPASVPLPFQTGIFVEGRPIMAVAAPVYNEHGQVIAALGFRILPEADFTQILQVARIGETGETYMFDENGVLLSDTRFNEQLKELGLLADTPHAQAILNIEIRDPGGNMLSGYRPTRPLRSRPLTHMAADAISGRSGVDTDGYPDYRGVPVIGAWTWLPELEVGVATEVSVTEAYQGLFFLQRGLWALIGLLVSSAVGMFLFSTVAARLRRKVEEVQKLGQYRLQQKIGEGGMGTVYLAQHALLRRPTAIKLLRPDRTSPESLARFEREVQFTSRLTHPNTIAIYDYGRTPEEVFYYAMEYLQGVTLYQCVKATGPQPEARVICILEQLCGSLAEAHAAGLVHRDIKPANIMLCERGGIFDFVKVLDFGLARQIEHPGELGLTNIKSLTGTPLYLSPEAIQAPDTVDARSDLYQVGAIAYYALTGQHVFTGSSVYEVCAHHLYTQPVVPSERLGCPLSSDLEELVLQCLHKDKTQRPVSAAALRQALGACTVAGQWTQTEAKAWWQLQRSTFGDAASSDATLAPDKGGGSHSHDIMIDLGQRIDAA